MFGQRVDIRTMLMAAAVDDLNLIAWLLLGADGSGIERPEPISDAITGKGRKKRSEDAADDFYTPESFEEQRRMIIEANKNVS